MMNNKGWKGEGQVKGEGEVFQQGIIEQWRLTLNFSKCVHPNITKLLGFSFSPLSLVFEFSPLGTLYDWLNGNRLKASDNITNNLSGEVAPNALKATAATTTTNEPTASAVEATNVNVTEDTNEKLEGETTTTTTTTTSNTPTKSTSSRNTPMPTRSTRSTDEISSSSAILTPRSLARALISLPPSLSNSSSSSAATAPSPPELTWPLRIRIACEIAKAILFLHSQNPSILHRDLKSPNILVHSLSVNDPVMVKGKNIRIKKNETPDFLIFSWEI